MDPPVDSGVVDLLMDECDGHFGELHGHIRVC